MTKVILKKGREESLLKGHHWIFSGAFAECPEKANGDIFPIFSSANELVAHAFINTTPRTIWGRILSFGNEDPIVALERLLFSALDRRKMFVEAPGTNSYRLVHGEGDRLPGLIVDQYGDYLVIQIHTLGMDKIKEKIVQLLVQKLAPKGILEKSSGPSRREEGLKDETKVLYGEVPTEIIMEENGHRFSVDPYQGQKTGFFLDQRELRKWLQDNAKGRSLLNVFCYSGGFTIYGLKGGAISATSLDSSAKAIDLVGKNLELNGLKEAAHTAIVADAFNFLKENPLPYDAIVLDPPALIKKKNDFTTGCRGYFEINRQALEKMAPNSLFITCSCSHHMEESLFLKIVQDAARKAGRALTLLHRHSLQPDHPMNPAHPESHYLKGLVFSVA